MESSIREKLSRSIEDRYEHIKWKDKKGSRIKTKRIDTNRTIVNEYSIEEIVSQHLRRISNSRACDCIPNGVVYKKLAYYPFITYNDFAFRCTLISVIIHEVQ